MSEERRKNGDEGQRQCQKCGVKLGDEEEEMPLDLVMCQACFKEVMGVAVRTGQRVENALEMGAIPPLPTPPED